MADAPIDLCGHGTPGEGALRGARREVRRGPARSGASPRHVPGPQPARRRALVWLAALAVAAGCTSAETDGPGLPSVVVIVIDTLRADHLPFYGYDRPTAPFLSELAAEGVVFETVWSTSSWTAPAVASLFTSVLPQQHGVTLPPYRHRGEQGESYRFPRLPSELTTLPELMKSLGYRTFGVADNVNVRRRTGFAEGFDRFHGFDYAGAEAVNAKLLEWRELIAAADRSFLYVHYMDPHVPYHRREPWFDFDERPLGPAGRLGRVPERGLVARDREALLATGAGPEQRHELERYAADLFRAAYDSEIRYLDEHIRALFSALEIGRDALVVVTSDHGEEFGEHGRIGHEFTLYSELLRVPLLLRLPGPDPPIGRASAPASLLDLLPTLRELLGQPPHPQDVGVSLAGAIRGDPPGRRALLAMRSEIRDGRTAHLKAVVAGSDKLIVSLPSGRAELFDLATDPAERSNRAAARPEEVERLRRVLRESERGLRRYRRAVASLAAGDETLEALRRLGYVDDEAPAGR